jgi:hypothetical protein
LKIPNEVWYGSSADYSKLKVFSWLTYTHVKEGKPGLRARKCIFLDHTSKMKVYWVWCVDSKSLKFITNNNMIFDKSQGKEVNLFWCWDGPGY